MRKITLIRHAKVIIGQDDKIDSTAFKKWVEAYDEAKINTKTLPGKHVYDAVLQADIILSSSQKRSIASVRLLGYTPFQADALFDEATVPDAKIPLLRLKPKRWLHLLRILLLLGLGKDDSSFKTSKARAKRATNRLLALSKKHEDIVLVGHGGMNWLIRKELQALGWILKREPSNAHWGMTELEFL